MSKRLGRREFLSLIGKGLGAGVTMTLVAPRAHAVPAGPPTDGSAYDWEAHSCVYLIDLSKCIGCGMCVRSCKRENDVPDQFFRTWIERYAVIGHEGAHVDSPDGGIDGFVPDPNAPKATKSPKKWD